MSKVNIALDASMLDMLQLCMCRFNNRYNLNKVSKAKPKQLDRGTVIHLGLETYYNCLKEGKQYNDAAHEMLRTAGLAIVESDLDVAESREVTRALEENVEYWKVDDQRYIIHEVEKSFMYVLFQDEDLQILMIGKIDLLLSDNQYFNLPMDHKSFDRDFPIPRLSNQFLNYSNAVKSNFLVVNRIGMQKTLKPHEKYKRVMLSYDPLIIDEWKLNVKLWVNQYLTCVAENTWPMNFTSCDKYHRRCEYADVCESSGIEAKMWKLDTDFVTTEPWDVSKQLGIKEVKE